MNVARGRLVPSTVWSGPSLAHRCCRTCGAVYRTELACCPIDGNTLAIAGDDPLIGKALDRYVIDGVIGQGAMGRVYRAHHGRLPHRRYAIKVLLGELAASPMMRMRFKREAEAAAKLAHPNVIGVVDFGRSPTGLLYLAMELVDGETLGQILRRAPLSPARTIHFARQLCDGLAHAHGHGVIHRDFKPDNILVVGDVARIGDFGLALSIADDARLTASGIVCTPAYAAPEQLLAAEIDHRADLYALGTTLYEMLTGVRPFAEHADKLACDPPPVLALAPHVPPRLARVIARLLERDPAKRPPSAAAVRDLLGPDAFAPTIELPIVRVRPRVWLAGVLRRITAAVVGLVP